MTQIKFSKDHKRAEAKVKRVITDEAIADLLEHTQFIGLCSELVKIEYANRLVDHKFKNPSINQHASRISQSAEMIQIHLASLTFNKDREFFSYAYCVQLHRILKHFMQLTIDQMDTFMTGVEKMQAEADAEAQKLEEA
jgi:N-formylglutamate amidohydrolase